VKPKELPPLMVSTREFRIADFGEALAVWRMVDGVEVAEGDSEQEVRAYLLRNPGLSRVAVNEGTIVGAVLCGHDGRRGLIYHLAVAPAYQGKGVGRRLLQECISG
jgi:ribosomal protein S18 acetylase RimI-like enzyme